MLLDLSKIAVVILAAGKGTRLNCVDKPKVMLEIGGKPIVAYLVETLKQIGFSKEQICLVVGFKKEKIQEYFKDEVQYAVQEQQLGTGHAAYVGIKSLSPEIEQVLVVGGDDGAFFTPATILNFIRQHLDNACTVSLMSLEIDNPAGFGRIVRENGEIKMIEKEYQTEEQKKIKEVGIGTYLFDRKWFEAMFLHMPKMAKLGEYGINPAIAIAQTENKKVQVVKLANINEWHGINTPEQLELANQLKKENNYI
jgi:bifunctional UDP-N-acetylglucosamine pyrophosphorylase/glucosamine-1-phosphate N-acetyltransferase